MNTRIDVSGYIFRGTIAKIRVWPTNSLWNERRSQKRKQILAHRYSFTIILRKNEIRTQNLTEDNLLVVLLSKLPKFTHPKIDEPIVADPK